MVEHETIEQLAKNTLRRASIETAAGVFVLISNVYSLQNSVIGSAKYYGCLIVIASICFILGVVWSFTISHRLVEKHPITDSVFWREKFETQAKLLRFAPLWYIAPMTAGSILVVMPKNENEFTTFLIKFLIIAIIAAGIVFLNKKAAEAIECDAAKL